MFSVFRRNLEQPVAGHAFSVGRANVQAVDGEDTFLAVKAVHPLSVTVFLDADGGSCQVASISTTAGSKIGPLPSCTRSDHRFVTWVDANGREVTEASVVTSDLAVLRAVYSVPVLLALDYGPGVQDGNPASLKVWPGFEIGSLPRPNGPSDRPDFIAWHAESGAVVTEATVFDGSYASIVASYARCSYEVDLAGGWFRNDSLSPEGHDGVYTSFGNHGVNDSVCVLKISVVGYSSFRILFGSHSEKGWDFVVASRPDVDLSRFSSEELRHDSGENVVSDNRDDTRTIPGDPTTYVEVEYVLDGGEHDLYFAYVKDGSAYDGDDRGFVLIPQQ